MKRKPLPLVVALLAAIGAAYFAFFHRADSEPGAGGVGFDRPAASVRVAAVEQGAFEVQAQFVGTLRAAAFAELYAKASGQIVEMNAETGERVRQGQVLARIDPVEALEKVQRERAALAMAEATAAQRQAALRVAETTDARVTALYQQQLVSQQDQEAARAELLSARAALEMATAAIGVARANLNAAQVELDNTSIAAPFDGYIGKRYLDLGAFAAGERPVFSLVDLSTIRTTVSLVEKDAARIAVGQPATLSTEAFAGESFAGRVARIASVFDPETNTVEAEIEVDNPDARLKPGMFATVTIAFRTEPTALLVPRSALLSERRETAVFVAEAATENGAWTARRVVVRPLGESARPGDERIAVEGDLTVGTAVVTLGQEGLRDGAPIAIAGGAEQRDVRPTPH